jgi:hypothetical protein
MTVAPQKDIWPHGRTYPRNAVAMTTKKIVIPDIQVSIKIKEL